MNRFAHMFVVILLLFSNAGCTVQSSTSAEAANESVKCRDVYAQLNNGKTIGDIADNLRVPTQFVTDCKERAEHLLADFEQKYGSYRLPDSHAEFLAMAEKRYAWTHRDQRANSAASTQAALFLYRLPMQPRGVAPSY